MLEFAVFFPPNWVQSPHAVSSKWLLHITSFKIFHLIRTSGPPPLEDVSPRQSARVQGGVAPHISIDGSLRHRCHHLTRNPFNSLRRCTLTCVPPNTTALIGKLARENTDAQLTGSHRPSRQARSAMGGGKTAEREAQIKAVHASFNYYLPDWAVWTPSEVGLCSTVTLWNGVCAAIRLETLTRWRTSGSCEPHAMERN